MTILVVNKFTEQTRRSEIQQLGLGSLICHCGQSETSYCNYKCMMLFQITPPGKDTLMSVLVFGSDGNEDQLSPRKEVEDEKFGFGSTLEIGTAIVGVALEM